MRKRIPESLNEFVETYIVNEEVFLNTKNSTIRKDRKRQFELRLEKLKEINAPAIMIKQQEKMIDEIDSWTNKQCKGIEEFGDEIFASVESKKGNGGVSFVQYKLKDGRIINFFPNAKYGPFFSEYTK